MSGHVIERLPLEEGSLILKNQLVRLFCDHDSPVAPVVLMRDAVVEGFQNDFLIVFGHFDGK